MPHRHRTRTHCDGRSTARHIGCIRSPRGAADPVRDRTPAAPARPSTDRKSWISVRSVLFLFWLDDDMARAPPRSRGRFDTAFPGPRVGAAASAYPYVPEALV